MSRKFLNQGHAEDVIMRLRYLYYVEARPLLTDRVYDKVEAFIQAQWSVSIVTHEVGSSRAEDYSWYIVEGRRPNAEERLERDKRISKRWMDNL